MSHKGSGIKPVVLLDLKERTSKYTDFLGRGVIMLYSEPWARPVDSDPPDTSLLDFHDYSNADGFLYHNLRRNGLKNFKVCPRV